MRDLARKRSWSFRESLGYRRKLDLKSENSEASKTLDSTDSSDTRNANCQFSSLESSLYSEDILNSLISNSSYCGIPCSRLALVDPCQRILFKDLLKKSLMNSEFEDNYYFSWNVWTILLDDDEDKKLHLYSVIETEADLKVFIKNDLPKILNSENTLPPKIHIFKLGMNPNKNELPNGFTIEVRVHKAALKFLKKIAHFVFSNQVYNTESLKGKSTPIKYHGRKILTCYSSDMWNLFKIVNELCRYINLDPSNIQSFK